jgi:hypothetical protein
MTGLHPSFILSLRGAARIGPFHLSFLSIGSGKGGWKESENEELHPRRYMKSMNLRQGS